jgi:hypothetical protein
MQTHHSPRDHHSDEPRAVPVPATDADTKPLTIKPVTWTWTPRRVGLFIVGLLLAFVAGIMAMQLVDAAFLKHRRPHCPRAENDRGGDGGRHCMERGAPTDTAFVLRIESLRGAEDGLVVTVDPTCFRLSRVDAADSNAAVEAYDEILEVCSYPTQHLTIMTRVAPSALNMTARAIISDTGEVLDEATLTALSRDIQVVMLSPLWDVLPQVSAILAAEGSLRQTSPSVTRLHQYAAAHARLSPLSLLTPEERARAAEGAREAATRATNESMLSDAASSTASVAAGNRRRAENTTLAPEETLTRQPYDACDNQCLGMCGIGGETTCDCWEWVCPVVTWRYGVIPVLDEHASCSCNLGCFLHDLQTSCGTAALINASVPEWLSTSLQLIDRLGLPRIGQFDVNGVYSAPVVALMLVMSGRDFCDACPNTSLPVGVNPT